MFKGGIAASPLEQQVEIRHLLGRFVFYKSSYIPKVFLLFLHLLLKECLA